jgi:hypothetical protein
MIRSGFYGMKSGDWKCTHVGVASITGAYKQKKVNGKAVRNKTPGHRNYYYIFERLTSDQKAMKMIRLTAQQVRKVRDGWFTVEELADKKAAKRSQVFKEKVSYSFCD